MLDLEPIRQRWQRYGIDNQGAHPDELAATGWHGAAHLSAGDVPALIAEVERLRAELEHARDAKAAAVKHLTERITALEAEVPDAS